MIQFAIKNLGGNNVKTAINTTYAVHPTPDQTTRAITYTTQSKPNTALERE